MNYRTLARVDFLVVHASATPPSMDIGVEEIRRWHTKKGWIDVGYHKVIRRDGTEEDGRPLTAWGAHARGFNDASLGICLVGGIAEGSHSGNKDVGFRREDRYEANYTDAQYASLERLIYELLELHPDAELLGHRDLPKVRKACPCFDVRQWWRLKDYIP